MSSPHQKHRNRIRLALILVIYPIYKTFDYFLKDNYVWAIFMLMTSLLYVFAIVMIIRARRDKSNPPLQPQNAI